MNREEAVEYLTILGGIGGITDNEARALEIAIEALDKEPVLDKIRAKIEELDGRYVIGDYAIYGEDIPKYVKFLEVLHIIDKYKESEEEK